MKEKKEKRQSDEINRAELENEGKRVNEEGLWKRWVEEKNEKKRKRWVEEKNEKKQTNKQKKAKWWD